MEKLIHIYAEAEGNTFLQLVLIAVVIDTILEFFARSRKEGSILISGSTARSENAEC